MKSIEKLGPHKIGILQGVGLAAYISIIGIIFSNANKWFPEHQTTLGPVLFLTLFAVSVLVCGFISLGYPIYLFFIQKKKPEAIHIVAATTLTLIIFLIMVFIAIVIQ